MKFNDETNTILNGQIDAKLIAFITEKVAEQLACKKKNVVIFCGSSLGFHQALDELKKIKDENYDFCIYATDQANSVLDLDRVRECLHQEKIFSTKEMNPQQLSEEADMIIVPNMTIDMTAKLAACIADTPELELIQQALLKGKRVIATIDGCCPDCIARYQRDVCISDSLAEQLKKNLEKIKSFGICLAESKRVFEVVLQRPSETEAVKIHKKVLSQADVEEMKTFSVIKITGDTLVTQLAEEAAKDYGIRIIRE